jgi:hypothetical protein
VGDWGDAWLGAGGGGGVDDAAGGGKMDRHGGFVLV